MSDLISRKELIETLMKCRKLGRKTFEVVVNVINAQPTAYDVDKVVEELDCDRCESCSFLKVCAGSICCRECHKKTIEIVKQGGVADDVCEWKLEDEEANLHLTGCQQRQLIFEGTPKENGYRYCPYCGKKIKAVE